MKKKGFTLIELLVVIAIIALLMSILVPVLDMAREHAKRVKCSSNLRSVGQALGMYADAYEGKLPQNDDPGHPYTAYRGDKHYAKHPTKRTPMKMGLLYETGHISLPQIFYCPSNSWDWLQYESYTQPPPWGTLPQDYNTINGSNNWVRTGYSFYPQSTKKDSDRLPLVAEMQGEVDINRSVVTDVIWNFDKLSHVVGARPRGLNALFGFVPSSICLDHNQKTSSASMWKSGSNPHAFVNHF
ncbi:MAG: prepilin-type N-terminal cleavage/methylation domain-containing protein [Planctomycetota bacterium]|jgi:prepilin-type N-terminal cleavage/methylation domain-containing protein